MTARGFQKGTARTSSSRSSGSTKPEISMPRAPAWASQSLATSHEATAATSRLATALWVAFGRPSACPREEKMTMDTSSMTWLNPPPRFEIRGGDLHVWSGPKTDFWQGTYYGFHRDDGHLLHRAGQGDFTAEGSFSGRYHELYDQAGLMVRADATHWMKCGIEYTDGAMHFSVVVTNGNSDWSAFRLDNTFERM